MERVESLKGRVQELMNEKEDLVLMHQSDICIKEHLQNKMNDVDKVNMERSTELLFAKRRMQELEDEKQEYDR